MCLSNVAAQFSVSEISKRSWCHRANLADLYSVGSTLPALTKVPRCTHWSQQRTAGAQPPEALLAWSAIVLQEELESAVLKLLTVLLLLFF